MHRNSVLRQKCVRCLIVVSLQVLIEYHPHRDARRNSVRQILFKRGVVQFIHRDVDGVLGRVDQAIDHTEALVRFCDQGIARSLCNQHSKCERNESFQRIGPSA
jgi:hypothetical protein